MADRILESIKALPEQVVQAWQEVGALKLPEEYGNCEQVVISGMGGSALGGRVIDALVFERARVPIEIVTDYRLPNYVSEKTLVMVYSYSGNTEETLSVSREAQKRGARIFGVTTGGKLGAWLTREKCGSYVFEPKNNPSGQPRMGLGYAIASVLGFLSRFDYIHFTSEDVAEAVRNLRLHLAETDLAQMLVEKIGGKGLALVASEHLSGVVHAFKNQVNENAKTFAVAFDIPELNHHLMEGLRFPVKLKDELFFLLIESDLYLREVQKRYPLTAEVIEKNGFEVGVYRARSPKKLEQVFEVLALGSYISYFMAKRRRIDPTAIPWVDYFKRKLQ